MVLLIVSVGGHWAFLQSVAWMGMMIDYSRDGSVCVAITKTFDGKHPCCLCKAIEAGKKSEKKKESSVEIKKMEFPPYVADAPLILPARPPLFPRVDSAARSIFQKPLTPPPRTLAA